MIKRIAILALVFCIARSQRPPYAGSADRSRYPQVLPQYEGEQAVSLGNRINGDAPPATLTSTTTRPIPFDLPVDALGDVDLVNRIMTWPKEKQPFWFLNWKQIQENRGDNRHRTEQPVQSTPVYYNKHYR